MEMGVVEGVELGSTEAEPEREVPEALGLAAAEVAFKRPIGEAELEPEAEERKMGDPELEAEAVELAYEEEGLALAVEEVEMLGLLELETEPEGERLIKAAEGVEEEEAFTNEAETEGEIVALAVVEVEMLGFLVLETEPEAERLMRTAEGVELMEDVWEMEIEALLSKVTFTAAILTLDPVRLLNLLTQVLVSCTLA